MKYRLSLRESWDGEEVERPLYTNALPTPAMFIGRAQVVWRVEAVKINPTTYDDDPPEDVTVLVSRQYVMPGEFDERRPG